MSAERSVPSVRWVAAILLVLAAGLGCAQAQPKPKPEPQPQHKPQHKPQPQRKLQPQPQREESPFLLGFFAEYPFGEVNTAVISPDDSYANFNPIDSGYGLGLSVEYRLAPALRLFLDGSHSSYRKQVGIAGRNSSSFWVLLNDGGTNQLLFNDDAYFYMDATGFRLGAKLALPGRSFQPWVGAGYGYYRWDATYGTSDRSGQWGTEGGYAWGLTWLAGVDIRLPMAGGKGLWLNVFADLTSPAAFPVIEDLFQPGWTWDNSGGNPIMGPYRIGAGIGMPM